VLTDLLTTTLDHHGHGRTEKPSEQGRRDCLDSRGRLKYFSQCVGHRFDSDRRLHPKSFHYQAFLSAFVPTVARIVLPGRLRCLRGLVQPATDCRLPGGHTGPWSSLRRRAPAPVGPPWDHHQHPATPTPRYDADRDYADVGTPAAAVATLQLTERFQFDSRSGPPSGALNSQASGALLALRRTEGISRRNWSAVGFAGMPGWLA
jgi:hypothetical protein